MGQLSQDKSHIDATPQCKTSSLDSAHGTVKWQSQSKAPSLETAGTARRVRMSGSVSCLRWQLWPESLRCDLRTSEPGTLLKLPGSE